MVYKEEALKKLIDLVGEISKDPKNKDFRDNVLKAVTDAAPSNSSILNEIHEYCIQSNLKSHAESFYKDFKLSEIRNQLVNDFVRMEQYKRQNNFEQFCHAAHQQIECIVNRIWQPNTDFIKHILSNKNSLVYRLKNKDTKEFEQFTLWQLIMTTFKSQYDADKLFNGELYKWDYAYKLKAILYYYRFDRRIYDYYEFKKTYDSANEIYQSRNLTHRGGFQSDAQKQITDRIIKLKDRYFFRFHGFLEDFTSNINSNL